MVVSLCQMGLGQPTKTNRNNNTRPVIQLHTNTAQPNFLSGTQTMWRKWIAQWAVNSVTKVVGLSPTGGDAYFME